MNEKSTEELTKVAQQALKPHQIAQLVNKLRDIAREFHAHDCLRELISREVNSALTQRPTAQEVHPLASRCYAMSEPHLSGYRLVLGFETLEAVDAAHTWVANVRKATQQAERIAELTKEVDAKQAKIDALMLEYCPEEMTQEQIDNWVSHQLVVKVGEIE